MIKSPGKTLRWILIAFGMIVGLAVWATITKENQVSSFIIEFFDTWSPALSALAVVILAFIVFGQMRQSRRQTAIKELRDWAKAVYDLSLEPKPQDSAGIDALSKKFDPIINEMVVVLISAESISKDLFELTRKVTDMIVQLSRAIITGDKQFNSTSAMHELSDAATEIIEYVDKNP